MKPTEEQIKQMAVTIDSGFRCCFHKKTGEIINIMDEMHWGYTDDPIWDENQDYVDRNKEFFIEFEPMKSHESFKIMEDFADSVEDEKLQDMLFYALNGPKPFRNFKYHIDNSGEYRQKWFEFKAHRIMENIKNIIKANEEFFEE